MSLKMNNMNKSLVYLLLLLSFLALAVCVAALCDFELTVMSGSIFFTLLGLALFLFVSMCLQCWKEGLFERKAKLEQTLAELNISIEQKNTEKTNMEKDLNELRDKIDGLNKDDLSKRVEELEQINKDLQARIDTFMAVLGEN